MIYEFQATQSYNGYDKPWAPGAGLNKMEFPIVPRASLGDDLSECFFVKAGTYTCSFTECDAANWRYAIKMKDAEGNDLSDVEYKPNPYMTWNDAGKVWIGGANTTNKTLSITISADCYIRVCLSAGAVTASTKIDGSMMAEGSEALPYSPYANVCMPEGFNIWDPTNAEYIQVYAGYVNANTRELYLRPVYEEYAGEELVGPWMSSMDEYSEDATPTEGAFVIDFGGELTSYEITPFMLQTLLESLGIRQHFTNGAGLLNSLMDQAQGRVRSEEELLHLSRPLKVIAIGDQLPVGLTFKPISKDVLPGLPGKFIR